MDIALKIAQELDVKKSQVEAAIALIDEGNTIPFIARYRKEATGALNDEQLRDLFERLNYLRSLEERKQEIINLIDEQGKLTEELRSQILAAEKLVTLEDLYRPYKQKKMTRADLAKKRGLQPLADYIMAQNATSPIEEEAAKYVTGKITPASDSKEDQIKANQQEVMDVAAAIAGAQDIIAESVSDSATFRGRIREMTAKDGLLTSKAKDDQEKSVYENYYDFSEPVGKAAGHRILAINRGEAEKILTVKIEAPQDNILLYLEKQLLTSDNPYTTPLIKAAISDAYQRLIEPSIEREIRGELTAKAQDGAIDVFGKNLAQLLMQPPVAGQTVLGWDPAFRTGCKLAVVDPTGKVLFTTVIYPTAPHNKIEESKKILKQIIEKYHVTLISIGNGTASRESEQVVAELIKELQNPALHYVITNEAGASIYSASKLATEEFPEFDVGQRSAASIARRVQDPLAELVKIEPKAIGVGQYQHDMDQKKLSGALSGVVESCVNKVGVDLNTASAPLLTYISGISSAVAKSIVTYREEHGSFKNRKELLKVAKLGPKAFEQCAGFCRITGGDEILDSTGVHPESYDAARKLISEMGCEVNDEQKIISFEKAITDKAKLAEKVGCGEMTLTDILAELKKPGRDPRESMSAPILRSDVLQMSDLKPGMKLKGTVRNVIDFGAFVDIGVHQDGLVHISRITDHFIKHPLEAVSVGDIVDVTVLEVDEEKGRISLTMLDGERKTAPTKGGHSGNDKNKSERRRNDRRGSNRNSNGAHRNNRTDTKYEAKPGTLGYLMAQKGIK